MKKEELLTPTQLKKLMSYNIKKCTFIKGSATMLTKDAINDLIQQTRNKHSMAASEPWRQQMFMGIENFLAMLLKQIEC